MILNVNNLGREQDPVQGPPETFRAGPPTFVDHLLESGQGKILVSAGDFFCMVPLSRDFVFRSFGFVRN
jgi:hypothetical protein